MPLRVDFMREEEPFAVELDQVVKQYGSGTSGVKVLRGVSLCVKAGEFVAIMGPSGSGKSTLMNLFGCLDKPTEGTVRIDGTDVGTLDPESLARIRCQKVGFVFQAFNLLSNQTAKQNVELSMAILEQPSEYRSLRAGQLLDVVGLTHRKAHFPSELSGGEKQRVAIARALANKPSILLMDEPTGNLDSKSGLDVMRFIQALWKKGGLTVILITHEPDVASFAQRTIHVRDGLIEKKSRNPRGATP